MNKDQIPVFLACNADKFDPKVRETLRRTLEKMTDAKIVILTNTHYISPTSTFLISIFPGCERLLLNDTRMWFIKLITGYGLGIWWLSDIVTAKRRTKLYNFRKFMALAKTI